MRMQTREVDTNPRDVLLINAIEREVRLENEVRKIARYGAKAEVAARL